MSTTIPCVPIDCDFPPDLLLYSLDGLYFFLNNDLRFVLTCPPGYECTNFPIIWRTRRGTLPPVYVPTIRPVTQIIPLSIPCCNYQMVSATVYTVVNPTSGLLVSGYASTVPNPALYSGPLPPSYFNNVSLAQAQSDIQQFITQVIGNMMIQAAALEAACQLENPDSPTGPLIFPIGDPRNPNPPPGPPGHPYIPMRLGELVNPDACLNQPYSQLISVYGGNNPITFTVLAGTLPPGLSLNDYCAPGCSAQISGIPTSINNYTFTIQAKDALSRYAQRDYTIGVIGISNATTLADATPLEPYTDTLTGSGGTGPYTFSWDPDLNPGWIDDISTAGVITSSAGPPLSGACNTWILEVTVTDANGISCTQNPEIFETAGFVNAPEDGLQCSPYGPFQMDTMPPAPGMTFSGTLPAGLTISASGEITGTPTSPGTTSASITATSTTDPTCTVTKSFPITIFSSGLSYATAAQDCAWQRHDISAPFGNPTVTITAAGNVLTIVVDCPGGSGNGVEFDVRTLLGWCVTSGSYPITGTLSWTKVGTGNTSVQAFIVNNGINPGGAPWTTPGLFSLTVPKCSGALPGWKAIPLVNETKVTLSVDNNFTHAHLVVTVTFTITPAVPTGNGTCP